MSRSAPCAADAACSCRPRPSARAATSRATATARAVSLPRSFAHQMFGFGGTQEHTEMPRGSLRNSSKKKAQAASSPPPPPSAAWAPFDAVSRMSSRSPRSESSTDPRTNAARSDGPAAPQASRAYAAVPARASMAPATQPPVSGAHRGSSRTAQNARSARRTVASSTHAASFRDRRRLVRSSSKRMSLTVSHMCPRPVAAGCASRRSRTASKLAAPPRWIRRPTVSYLRRAVDGGASVEGRRTRARIRSSSAPRRGGTTP